MPDIGYYNPGGGTIWHAVPEDRTGTGTEGDPWGINQLITPAGRTGPALDAMGPGDTLWLAGGVYDFVTEGTPNSSYAYAILAPSATDCTIRSKPGEKAILRRRGGKSPLVGTYLRNGLHAHRTRIYGIEAVDLHDTEYQGANAELFGVRGANLTSRTIGCEIAWCRAIMGDITGSTTASQADNHQPILLHMSQEGWYHHNEIYGSLGTTMNSAGIKIYGTQGDIIEDNWIYGNKCGIYAKSSVRSTIIRRNLIEGNSINGNLKDIRLWDYGDDATCSVEVYDNVLDSNVESADYGHDVLVHHNLLRNSIYIVRRTKQNSHTIRIHSNIQHSPNTNCSPWYAIISLGAGYPGDPVALLEMDYNLVIAKTNATPNPTYPYTGQTFTLAQFRAEGFEVNSQFPSGGLAAIYDDVNDFSTLKAAYQTAGKAGSRVGPSDVALVLDTARYGPEALIALEAGSGPPPDPPDDPPPEPPPPVPKVKRSGTVSQGGSRKRVVFLIPGEG